MNMNDLLLSYRVDRNNNLEEVMQPQGETEHEGYESLVALNHFINIFIVIVGAG